MVQILAKASSRFMVPVANSRSAVIEGSTTQAAIKGALRIEDFLVVGIN